MSSRPWFHLLLLFSLVALSSSCSNLRKRQKEMGQGSLLISEPSLTPETVARLKRIADAPASNLVAAEISSPGETESVFDEAPSDSPSASPRPTDLSPPTPSSATISPGDIFTEHRGPVLDKWSSIADTLTSTEWERFLETETSKSRKRVPVTISSRELANLRQRNSNDLSLPTRSVALDLVTTETSVDPKDLETFWSNIESGSEEESGSPASHSKLKADLGKIRKEIKSGNSFYVIVSVNSSPSIKATYPGAPLGRRDAELVRNAVGGMYPHLDGLTAEKVGDAIEIKRTPAIYWEFGVREITLKDEKLVIRKAKNERESWWR